MLVLTLVHNLTVWVTLPKLLLRHISRLLCKHRERHCILEDEVAKTTEAYKVLNKDTNNIRYNFSVHQVHGKRVDSLL